LSPTYTNVINVYAFCNTHDLSWGTRPEEKTEAAGSATIKSDGKVDVDLSFVDPNDHYDSELQKFSTIADETKPAPNDKEKAKEKKEKEENYYKSIRSYVVLIWMFSNGALIAVVLKVGGLNRLSVQQPTDQGEPTTNVTVYLQVILWSVAALSAFKFVGAMWYQIIRLVSNLVDAHIDHCLQAE
jgi:chitin synthase